MDILEVVRQNVSILPEGPRREGLQHVLKHIEVAFKHLVRGRDQRDDSAFNDAVYRANQAFEGGLKETYRELSSKDPRHRSIECIEEYLRREGVLKERVLTQVAAYRREWRNPSTHEHNLLFDESEAFLAIMTVLTLSKLLIDEVVVSASSSAFANELRGREIPADLKMLQDQPLQHRVAALMNHFVNVYIPSRTSASFHGEMDFRGALYAYISGLLPKGTVTTEVMAEGASLRADIIITEGEQKVVVLAKMGAVKMVEDGGLRYLKECIKAFRANGGLLFIFGGVGVRHELEATRLGEVDVSFIAPRLVR